jgi:hypothetical protein
MVAGTLNAWNMQNKPARECFEKMIFYAKEGNTFKGSWFNKNSEVSSDPRVSGHRHDQSVLSILRYKYHIEKLTHFYSYNDGTRPISKNIYFFANGGLRPNDLNYVNYWNT